MSSYNWKWRFYIKSCCKEHIESYQELMLDKVTEIEVTDSLQSMVILSTFKDNKVVPVKNRKILSWILMILLIKLEEYLLR